MNADSPTRLIWIRKKWLVFCFVFEFADIFFNYFHELTRKLLLWTSMQT
jgi:hypothetical protein